MRYPDPGARNIRAPGAYLWWLVTSQPRRIAAGALLSTLWMVGLTVPPYLLSRAIDDGLRIGHVTALLGWVGALFVTGLLTAALALARHRVMTKIRLDAASRTVHTIVTQATRLGATLPRRVTAGEVVTIAIGDVWNMALALTITGPGIGGVIAYVVVAVLLLAISPVLAIVVLAGVPVLAVLIGPLLGRLQATGTAYREGQGALAARIVDIIAGLRVLQGLGGREIYAARYRRDSQNLVAQGYRVGAVTSWIQALGVGLPALFLAAVTWLAARMAVHGTITVGQLVAVYGYVAVLVLPVAFFIEGGFDLSRALVAARRVTRFLNLVPESADPTATTEAPTGPAVLHDPISGVRVEPGRLTAIAGARSADGQAVVDRLGRFGDTDATWGGIRLDRITADRVRARVLVADNEADLFAGTLRDVLSGRSDRDEATLTGSVHAAAADDIVLGRGGGLDAIITAQGRNLSGGQRQRVRLARALAADPEVLLAVDPTSAVDAHTEAAIAERLRSTRAGRTTVVTTTSPLMLDRADLVYYLIDGRVAATGTHHDLLLAEPGYHALVSRGLDDDSDRSTRPDRTAAR